MLWRYWLQAQKELRMPRISKTNLIWFEDSQANVFLSCTVCYGSGISVEKPRSLQLRGLFLASLSPLSSRSVPRAKRKGRKECLGHCPPRQSTVTGFVAVPAANVGLYHYLSTSSAHLSWLSNLDCISN